jgi:hypothetical protein
MTCRAANAANLRCVNGPATVRVKLLEQLEPYEPKCHKCKLSVAEHERTEVTTMGDWRRPENSNGYVPGEWDSTIPRVTVYWFCPVEAQP